MAFDLGLNKMGVYPEIKKQTAEPKVQQPTEVDTGTKTGLPVGKAEQASPEENKDQQEGKPTDQQMKAAIQQANKRGNFGHTNAQFVYHEATKRVSIKIIDSETDEVIREIPPERTLEMFAKMWELAGIMVDEKG